MLLCCSPFEGGRSIVVASLFIAAPIVCRGSVFCPCFVMQCLVFQFPVSSFVVISIGKGELINLRFKRMFLLMYGDCSCSVALSLIHLSK